jgi:aromatic ring-opening dioxygenase LigB subunit
MGTVPDALMGNIVAAIASSHAFALIEPREWDNLRDRNRKGYAQRYGSEPPNHPQILEETDADVEVRYGRVRAALTHLRGAIETVMPDALLIIGDDQNENYTAQNVPQFAIYTAEEALFFDRLTKREQTYSCDSDTARVILEGALEAGFDLSFSAGFPEKRLISHAHVEPLMRILLPTAEVPIVPIYVNAIHPPGPTPSRCFAFGQMIADVIRNKLGKKRIALYASGGLSHFTAGYPWHAYSGPFGYGAISEDFDRRIIQWMIDGQVEEIKKLTSKDLLDHGDIEFRSWIILLGAVGAVPAQILAYEPLYRGLMGMGVAQWPMDDSHPG